MARLIQWEQQIGRRLRLRDLFVFFTVVEYGSMAKAGAKLGVSTPSISEVIAGLEHALGVRLLDRSPHGIVMTAYGEALLARGRAAFDELRQGIRDIEFIGDPEAGELRIGCPESLAAGFLVAVLARFLKDHPRVRFHVAPVRQPTVEFPQLHERQVDLVLARLAREPVQGRLAEDLDAEILFHDRFSVVVGANSKWARRRKVDLADVVDAPWIMTPFDALGEDYFVRVFRARGLRLPSLVVTTFSIHLRNNLVGAGDYVTALPDSVLRIYRKPHALKELPIELSVRPPVAVVTLRNRTLGPTARLFIECARAVAASYDSHSTNSLKPPFATSANRRDRRPRH
jgi:DNA-binding transcriptional LysR family regulator